MHEIKTIKPIKHNKISTNKATKHSYVHECDRYGDNTQQIKA